MLIFFGNFLSFWLICSFHLAYRQRGKNKDSCREEKVCMCLKERVRRARTCPTAPRKPWNDWESLREPGPPHFNKWAHPLGFTVVIKRALSCLTKHLSPLPFARSVHCAGSYSCSEIMKHNLPAVICENLKIGNSPSRG